MHLTKFFNSLISTGHVVVSSKFHDFSPEDCESLKIVLMQYYDTDQLELAGTAPLLDKQAASWATQYLYRATQCAVIRNADEALIAKHLIPFTGEKSISIIYSVDLVMRHLSSIYSLAKRISPEDPLILHLNKCANEWPLSSWSIADKQVSDWKQLQQDPFLWSIFVDRIISSRDISQITAEDIKQAVAAALGSHTTSLVEEFNDLLTTN